MRVLARGFSVFALVLVCTTAQAAPERNVRAGDADAPAAAVIEAAPSPSEQHRALVDALIASDIEAIASQQSGESQEKLAHDWERERLNYAKSDHSSPVDVVIERFWTMLGTPEGTTELAGELYPAFAAQSDKAVAEFNGDFAKSLSELAGSDELSPDEVQQFSQLMLAAQRWVNGVDWQDRARFDRALDAVAGFVRRSGAKTLSEIRLLPYEEAAALGDDAIATVKRVLRVYDLDVDAMLASVKIEELSRDGDEATLRWSARVLDVPIAIVREMRYDRKFSERWVTAKAYEQLTRLVDESDVAAAQEIEFDVEPPPEPKRSADLGTCGKSAGDPDAKDQFWSEEK